MSSWTGKVGQAMSAANNSRFMPYWAGDSFDGRGGAPGLARIRPNVMPLDLLRSLLGGGAGGGAVRPMGLMGGGYFGGVSPETLDVLREIRMRRYFGLDPRMYQGGGLASFIGGGMSQGARTPSMLASFMPGQGPGRGGNGA